MYYVSESGTIEWEEFLEIFSVMRQMKEKQEVDPSQKQRIAQAAFAEAWLCARGAAFGASTFTHMPRGARARFGSSSIQVFRSSKLNK